MIYLFVLGAIAQAVVVALKDKQDQICNIILISLIPTLIIFIPMLLLTAQSSNFSWTDEVIYSYFIFLSGVLVSEIPAQFFMMLSEKLLLQITIIFLYAAHTFFSFTSIWPLLLTYFFSLFVLIEVFSRKEHTGFTKRFYTAWYIIVSLSMMYIAFSETELGSYMINMSSSNSYAVTDYLDAFLAGLIGLQVLCTFLASIMLVALAFYRDKEGNMVDFPQEYLGTHMPRREVFLLLVFWITIFIFNYNYELIAHSTMTYIAYCMVIERSYLRQKQE